MANWPNENTSPRKSLYTTVAQNYPPSPIEADLPQTVIVIDLFPYFVCITPESVLSISYLFLFSYSLSVSHSFESGLYLNGCLLHFRVIEVNIYLFCLGGSTHSPHHHRLLLFWCWTFSAHHGWHLSHLWWSWLVVWRFQYWISCKLLCCICRFGLRLQV